MRSLLELWSQWVFYLSWHLVRLTCDSMKPKRFVCMMVVQQIPAKRARSMFLMLQLIYHHFDHVNPSKIPNIIYKSFSICSVASHTDCSNCRWTLSITLRSRDRWRKNVTQVDSAPITSKTPSNVQKLRSSTQATLSQLQSETKRKFNRLSVRMDFLKENTFWKRFHHSYTVTLLCCGCEHKLLCFCWLFRNLLKNK